MASISRQRSVSRVLNRGARKRTQKEKDRQAYSNPASVKQVSRGEGKLGKLTRQQKIAQQSDVRASSRAYGIQANGSRTGVSPTKRPQTRDQADLNRDLRIAGERQLGQSKNKYVQARNNTRDLAVRAEEVFKGEVSKRRSAATAEQDSAFKKYQTKRTAEEFSKIDSAGLKKGYLSTIDRLTKKGTRNGHFSSSDISENEARQLSQARRNIKRIEQGLPPLQYGKKRGASRSGFVTTEEDPLSGLRAEFEATDEYKNLGYNEDEDMMLSGIKAQLARTEQAGGVRPTEAPRDRFSFQRESEDAKQSFNIEADEQRAEINTGIRNEKNQEIAKLDQGLSGMNETIADAYRKAGLRSIEEKYRKKQTAGLAEVARIQKENQQAYISQQEEDAKLSPKERLAKQKESEKVEGINNILEEFEGKGEDISTQKAENIWNARQKFTEGKSKTDKQTAKELDSIFSAPDFDEKSTYSVAFNSFEGLDARKKTEDYLSSRFVPESQIRDMRAEYLKAKGYTDEEVAEFDDEVTVEEVMRKSNDKGTESLTFAELDKLNKYVATNPKKAYRLKLLADDPTLSPLEAFTMAEEEFAEAKPETTKAGIENKLFTDAYEKAKEGGASETEAFRQAEASRKKPKATGGGVAGVGELSTIEQTVYDNLTAEGLGVNDLIEDSRGLTSKQKERVAKRLVADTVVARAEEAERKGLVGASGFSVGETEDLMNKLQRDADSLKSAEEKVGFWGEIKNLFGGEEEEETNTDTDDFDSAFDDAFAKANQ